MAGYNKIKQKNERLVLYNIKFFILFCVNQGMTRLFNSHMCEMSKNIYYYIFLEAAEN